MQLLVKDGFEEGLEGRGRGGKAEREGAGATDEFGKFGVGRLEMRDGLGRVKGKFAAAAVVNNGRSL
jgi:hypothetical protein